MTIRPPSPGESRLIVRFLIEKEMLDCDQAEVWKYGSAWRILGTLRECTDAINLLIAGSHAVKASFVQACVMQADGISEVPFCLAELSEFLVEDAEARAYWQGMCSDDRFPHRCHRCGGAAFVGFLQVECKSKCSGL